MTGHFSRANAGAAREQSEFDLLYCTHDGSARTFEPLDTREECRHAGMPGVRNGAPPRKE